MIKIKTPLIEDIVGYNPKFGFKEEVFFMFENMIRTSYIEKIFSECYVAESESDDNLFFEYSYELWDFSGNFPEERLFKNQRELLKSIKTMSWSDSELTPHDLI